ncbi:MAG: EAL domain-containing protein [Herminiimonas sp.]|nr:EAL domain-containing protein [Herminiimonas sp.]
MATDAPLLTIDLHLSRALDSARQVSFDWRIPEDVLYLSGELSESFRGVLITPASTWHSRDLFALVCEEDRDPFLNGLHQMLRGSDGGTPLVVHAAALRLRDHLDGWRWVEIHAQVVERDAVGRALRAVGTLSDINARKQDERRIGRLRDLYEALSQTNKAIVRMGEPQQLFEEICRIAIEYGRFHLAWIGLIDDQTLRVNPVARTGQSIAALDAAVFSVDPSIPEGRGGIGTAIRNDRPSVFNDFFSSPSLQPWHDRAKESGFRSFATFPFKSDGRIVGTLSLYSTDRDFFDPSLIALLTEMASDISFALDHHGREKAREKAEAALARSEHLKSAIVAAALDCIVTIDQDGRIVDFNAAAENTFGHHSADVIGRVMSEIIVPPAMRMRHDEGMEAYVKTGESKILNRRIELEAMHADGHLFPIELTVMPATVDGRQIFTAFMRDISERKRSEQLQTMQNRILGQVATGAPLNEIMRELRSFIEQQAGPARCSAMLLEEGASMLHAAAIDSLPDGYRTLFEQVAIGAAGRTCGVAAARGKLVETADIACDPLWAEAREVAAANDICAVSCWPIPGKQRMVLGTLSVHFKQVGLKSKQHRQLMDLATNLARIAIESRESEERIRFLAHYDGLTALPNRFLFKEFLEHALLAARRSSTRFAVFFVDLDRFKNINDTFGHDAGDRVLREIATRLSAALRESDIVARMGGDEFYVLIEHLPETAYAAEVAQKLLNEASRPFYVDGQECQLTASIGIVVCPDDGADSQTLLKNSDIAMYRAKALGKNGYQFYAASDDMHSIERIGLESRLRRAIEQQEFVLHYQPKLDLMSGDITGLEALVRWQHPEHGLLAPAHFIGMAEETGLIVPLGKAILDMASQDSARLQNLFPQPVRIAVNLSARQLDDPRFLDDMRRLIDAPRTHPLPLDLEITESMIMPSPEKAVHILTALQAMGIRLVIDDFGTGYSSLAYLKRFPVHGLKIDRSFVQDIPDDVNDTAITQAVIAMGHSLGMRVVAEGVETQAQMDALRRFGCDELQGYFFCRPIPLDDVIALLRTRLAES